MDTRQKSKKSKHGKKNWRKNIDVSEIESKTKIINKEEMMTRNVEKMMEKDQLFTMDYSKGKAKEKYTGKKRDRPVKKLSINEQRKIKRIVEHTLNSNDKPAMKKDKEITIEESYDLWGDDDNVAKKTKKNNKMISYPVVPLPHPGQSYNPSKDDLSKLLYKVVELNKPLERKIIRDEEEKKRKAEQVQEENDDDDEEDDDDGEDNEDDEEEEESEDSVIITHPVSNNPPVDESNRLSKKEKRQKENRKQHELRVKEAMRKKQAKIALANEKSTKNIEKAKKKLEDEKLKQKKVKEEASKKLQSQYTHGIIEDKDLLEDFIVKKEPIPLRKMKTNQNYLSERFENIIKRNVIGKDDQKHMKKNHRLNKVITMDPGTTFMDDAGHANLKIFN